MKLDMSVKTVYFTGAWSGSDNTCNTAYESVRMSVSMGRGRLQIIMTQTFVDGLLADMCFHSQVGSQTFYSNGSVVHSRRPYELVVVVFRHPGFTDHERS